MHDVTCHVAAEGIGLYGVAFLLQRQTDGCQGILAIGLRLDIIHSQPYIAVLTLAVQLVGGVVGGVMHAVAYGHLAAAQRYAVQALRGVVVVVVVLVRLRLKLITAVVVEHRIAHRVTDRAVLLLGVEVDFLLDGRIQAAGVHRRFAVAVLLQSVQQLLEVYLHRRAVDAVIYGVVMHAVVPAHRIDGLQRSVRQVEGLAACARGKQCGVTLRRGLYNLVLNREQIHLKLTRLRIGMDSDAFLLQQGVRCAHYAVGLKLVAKLIYAMLHLLHHRVAAQVIRVVHEVRYVVALELQHELQVIAEVVRTEAEGFGQVALVDTAGYTADEAHLGLVVEPYAVQRLGQGKRVCPFLYVQDSFALKHVSRLEDMQCVGLTLAQRQLEITVRTRHQRYAVAQHRVAVEREHRPGYGDGREFVQRASCQADGGGIDEVDVRGYSMIRRQRHAGALGTRIIITELRVRVRRHYSELRTAADVVGQAVKQERTVGACYG